MVALFIVSAGEAAGKTMICAGIGRYLLGEGKQAGFLKLSAAGGDADAAFMKQVLNLTEAVDFICPPASGPGQVAEACSRVSQDKDVIIVEGASGSTPEDNYETASNLKAKVIVVEADFDQPGKSIDICQGFGENLLGVVLNKVPESRLTHVHEQASARFDKAGIKVLGVLPEDRVLAALTVGELAETVQGEMLNNAEKSAELVENFMLGAMVVDSGLEYFGRKTGKAAVLRSDRPDMQLAALETPTRCLVLSGSASPPAYSVLNKAENKGIPVISTENDTNSIITSVEDALGKGRFSQEKKLSGLAGILEQHLDLPAVNKGLGLSG